MSKFKELFFNTLIFGISDFSSKILVFIMLPVYTRYMQPQDFGAADLVNTTISFLIPLFSISITNGVFRFAFDKTLNQKALFTYGVKILFIGYLILLMLYPLFNKINVIKDYLFLFYLSYLFQVIYTYFNLFIRSLGNIKSIGICGILNALLIVIFNILFLVIFNLKVYGYLSSYIIGNFVTLTMLFFWNKLWRFFTNERLDKSTKTELLNYSIPLTPNSLSWWLNNSANRYIINYYCSIYDVGLFSAASRIPTMLTTFQNIFSQSWTLSGIKEYEINKDSNGLYAIVYNYFNVFSILTTLLFIAFVKIIASFLFSENYYEAWYLVPFLLLAIMFGGLSGFLGSAYSAVKNSKMLFISTAIGAVIAVGMNLLLIPLLGTIGASIACFCSYIFIWGIRAIHTKKYIRMIKTPIKDIFSYLLLIIQSIVIMKAVNFQGYIVSFIVFIIIIIIYRKSLFDLCKISFLHLRLKIKK